MVFIKKKIILIIKYLNALIPHIYVTRLSVKWTEDEKIFFQRNAFSVFHYSTAELHNKLKLQSEKKIGLSMQKRKAIFVKQCSFVQS